jgi:hypothetical protein
MAQHRGQLVGIVRDSSSAVIQDAAVSVVSTDTGIRRSARSNGDGLYAVSSLPPGNYKVTVRKQGFHTVARLGIVVQATESARVDFTMQIGSMHEVITVEAAAPLINTEDAASGVIMTRTETEQLPLNGRGLQGLLEFAPGVLATPATAGEAGQFTANGQRPSTNYFTVDGVSANNGVSGSGVPGQFSGGSLPGMTAIGSLHGLVSPGELSEVRVQTSTFAPEFGRLPGAQVAVSTRSGSNQFHGEVFENFRHEWLSAENWFVGQRNLPRGPQRLNDFGAVLGGPLRRNQTFFFASTEFLRLRSPAVSRTVVPSLATRSVAEGDAARILNAFPLPNGPDLRDGAAEHFAQTSWPSRLTSSSVRIDHALGTAGTLFVRYSDTPSSNRIGYLQTNDARFRSRGLTAAVATVLSPTLTNDLRINVSRSSVRSEWTMQAPDGAQRLDLSTVLPALTEPGQRLYGLAINGIGQLLYGDAGRSRQGQWDFINTLAVTRGNHQFRIGADYQRITPTRERTIFSVAGVYNSVADLLAGNAPSLTFARAGAGSSLIETFSGFAQDTWHATPRLTLTYGTRWELVPAPSFRSPELDPNTGIVVPGGGALPEGFPGNAPILPVPFPESGPGRLFGESYLDTPSWPMRYTYFAPRIGAAYRLNAPGTAVLRAGAGLFYDLGFASATDPLNGAPYNRWRAMTASLGTDLLPSAESALEYGFAPDLKLPYSLQWNVTAERAHGEEGVISAAYVGSAGRRLLRREGYLRPETGVPQLLLATNNGKSDYHSLQLQYRRRAGRALRGILSYTWAHSIDNGSWDSAAYLVYPGAGSTQDRGSSNFDVRHSFQAALAWDLPRASLPDPFQPVFRGWTLAGVFRARTGFPIDVVSIDNAFGLEFDNVSRPDLVAGQPLWLADPNSPAGRKLNPSAFSAAAAGTQGTLGRNALRGAGLVQLDTSLQRRFILWEGGSLEFRADVYNLLNRAHLADPVRFLSSPLFGQPASLLNLVLGAGRPNAGLTPAFQSGGPRAVQLGLRLRW